MKNLVGIILIVLSSQSLYAQHKTLSYQGVLLDANGKPVEDDSYSAVFELFDVETNGSDLWDTTGVSISTVNGAFSVSLQVSDEIDFTKTLWLGIQVAGSSFGERVRIDPEPTALSVESSLITMVSNRGSAVPIGTVVAFAGAIESIPDGWLVCDGSPFSTDDYPELANVLKNYWSNTGDALPDLRGMFLRGVSGDSGVDPDVEIRTSKTNGEKNMVGTTQEDATAINGVTVNRSEIGTKATSSNGSHDHFTAINENNDAQSEAVSTTRSMYRASNTGEQRYVLQGSSASPNVSPTSNTGSHNHNINVDHNHNLSSTDGETRPINAYVYYIIKAK